MRLNTLLLDQDSWDLLLDSSGNIAMAAPPYALAQDVASAIRLFAGELWYDTSKGIAYKETILGTLPPINIVTAQMEAAAMTVPGVVSARADIRLDKATRTIVGSVEFIDEIGKTNNVNF